MEIANVIKWLSDGHKSGYLTDEKTGLPLAKIGTREFFERLITMVASREGFGEVLAEGLLRAGEQLGEEAKSLFTNEVSGVGGGASYSPREYITNALLYALEPRQPIAMLHEVSRLIALWVMNRTRPGSTPVTSEVFRSAATRFWGSERAWDLTTHEGKAEAAASILDRSYVKDSLLLCDASWPMIVSFSTPDGVGDPTVESKILSAVTGIDTDEDGLKLYGERIFNLQRAILLREGWRPGEDDVPAAFNFVDPVETAFMNPDLLVPGPEEEPVCVKGNTLNKKSFEAMREEFYELRGWDPETGLQMAGTLEQLELSDVSQDLMKSGLVK
jgi:aldehyde:ferredoxin oxidoreductase